MTRENDGMITMSLQPGDNRMTVVDILSRDFFHKKSGLLAASRGEKTGLSTEIGAANCLICQ